MTGHLAFHARVAANALAIVARELELGQVQQADAEQADGEVSLADLASRVAASLAIANPKYFGVNYSRGNTPRLPPEKD